MFETYLGGDLDAGFVLGVLLDTSDTARVDHPEFDWTAGGTGVDEQNTGFSAR